MRAKALCKVCEGIQDATRDENGSPVYVCRCCYAITPRRTNTSKKREDRKVILEELLKEFGI